MLKKIDFYNRLKKVHNERLNDFENLNNCPPLIFNHIVKFDNSINFY